MCRGERRGDTGQGHHPQGVSQTLLEVLRRRGQSQYNKNQANG